MFDQLSTKVAINLISVIKFNIVILAHSYHFCIRRSSADGKIPDNVFNFASTHSCRGVFKEKTKVFFLMLDSQVSVIIPVPILQEIILRSDTKEILFFRQTCKLFQ